MVAGSPGYVQVYCRLQFGAPDFRARQGALSGTAATERLQVEVRSARGGCRMSNRRRRRRRCDRTSPFTGLKNPSAVRRQVGSKRGA
jgi:hypothetical protein